MKKIILVIIISMLTLTSCNKEKKILETLNEHNDSMQSKGYKMGDRLEIPKKIVDETDEIKISFGDRETSNLIIDPKYFVLGNNTVSFVMKMKNGKIIYQDAMINVFAKKIEKDMEYRILSEYPHNPSDFVQGFEMEGNEIYESDGQNGSSQVVKYTLGSTKPDVFTKLSDEYFGEGCTIVGDKLYQLTWKSRKGFIYDKNTLKLLSEFKYPEIFGDGWGICYNGRDLIATDGSNLLYYLDVNNPSKVLRTLQVVGAGKVYEKMNELEYKNGFIYANIWQEPIIIKINAITGEVVEKFDFTQIANKHTKGSDDILNGITFKGENLLVTGKNWPTIYEVQIIK